MKTVSLLLLTSVMVIFLGFILTPVKADGTNGISIQNISVQPYVIKVGDTFTVTATLVNNSTLPIIVDGGKCSAQDKQAEMFTMMFDNHTKNKPENINCAGVGWSEILDPGKNITETSPDYTANYVATESGTANVTVTFSYHAIIQRDPIQTGDEQTISKSFQFQIHDVNSDSSGPQMSIPKTISPLKQFESGVPLKDTTCAPNFQLIIKAESHSPACVKPDDVSKLVERGWADKPNSLQEQLDFTNVCTGMNDACKNNYDVKSSDPFGITALIIYHPPDLCLNPTSHSIPTGMPSCPPNKFYLKINSNSTAYLLGYDICDGNSCATNNTLSLLLPLNTGLHPDYQMIGLPIDLQWKMGDMVNIQITASHDADNKTTSQIDLGSSTIVP